MIQKGQGSVSGSLSTPPSANPQQNTLNYRPASSGVRILSQNESRVVNGNSCQEHNPAFVIDIGNLNLPDGVAITGCIGLSVDYDIKVEIDDWKLQKYYAAITPTQSIQISFNALNYLKLGSISLEKTIFTQKLGVITLFIGVMPVTIVVELQVVVGLGVGFEASGEVSTNLSMSGTASSSVKIGVEYTDGSGWKSFKETENKFSYVPPDIHISAKRVEVFAGPELAFLFYNIAGPEVYLNGYIAIETDRRVNPWWALYGGIKAGIGAELNLNLLVKKISLAANFPDIINYKTPLAHADGG